jgi:DNA-binding response OmpR family regulator/DNA-binding CsgD family transcriptional regulator
MNNITQQKTLVLVVDQDQNDISQLRQSIVALHENFHVSNVQNMATAFNLLESNDYDLIIMKWEIIKASGYELLELPKKIATLFILNEDEDFEKVKGLTKLRDSCCIQKPINTTELLVKINTLMQLAYSKKNTETKVESHMEDDRKHAEIKDRELNSKILEINHKTRVLQDLQHKMEDLLPLIDEDLKMSFKELISIVKMSIGDKKTLNTFSQFFENVHPEFFSYFRQRFTRLTIEDIRYCAYLKMQMSNREIAILLNINQESVRTHKYRLKKKMELGKEVDLQKYIDDQKTSLPASYG